MAWLDDAAAFYASARQHAVPARVRPLLPRAPAVALACAAALLLVLPRVVLGAAALAAAFVYGVLAATPADANWTQALLDAHAGDTHTLAYDAVRRFRATGEVGALPLRVRWS